MSSPATPTTPSASFNDALALFNQRQFFECHEVLEDIWRPLPKGPEKWFMQGLLQVGVGFHHLEQQNYTGAKSLLNSGIEKLEMIAAQKAYAAPIDLAPFLKSSRAAYETVVVLGPDCMGEFPESLIPQVTAL